MFHTLLGLPSRFTNWCASALEQCLRATGNEVLIVTASTLDDLQPTLASASAGATVLLISDSPSRELITVVERSGGPVSISLVPPLSSAVYIHELGVPQVEATQFVSVRCCLLHELICDPAINVVTQSPPFGGRDVLSALLQHHGVSLPDDGFNIVGDGLPEPDEAFLDHEMIASSLAASLSSLQPLFERKAVSSIEWLPDLFTRDHPPAGPATGRLDMTGPSRVFIWGPYQHIPEGKWRVEADFSVSDNLSGNILKVDLFQNGAPEPLLVEGKWSLPPNGRFRAGMQFEAGDPARSTEVRFWMLEGVIEGFFELHGVSLERLPAGVPTLPLTDRSSSTDGFPQSASRL